MTDKIVVLVTCGKAPEAARLAHVLVEMRLAACVNLLEAPVHSVFRWKDKIQTAREYLLVIKSSRARFAAVRRAIEVAHSYDVPEIIALPIVDGSAAYLRWLEESVSPPHGRKKPRSSK